MKLRFGIIGCGRIAPSHGEALTKMLTDEAELIAVCDIIPERANSFGERYGVKKIYYDHHDLLQDQEIDIVCICTPSGYHAALGIEAANAGKHVVVEKPMALSLADADRLIAACHANKVTLGVVHQNRFNPAIKLVRNAFEAGRFGALTHANAAIRWCRDQKYYDAASWRGTWAQDGGVLMNQSIHNIDLLQWIMGAPTEIYAYTATRLRQIEAEDVAVAILKFANGAFGIIEAASTIFPRNLEETLSIFGATGSVIVGGIAVNRIEAWRFGDDNEEQQILSGQQSDPPTVYGFGHRELLSNVIQAIRAGKRPLVDGEEGRKALEIILGIYHAVRFGTPIKFPLQEKADSLTALMGGKS
ncbi:MAG TPA: oxidoreductase [Firmicutes bacterium]|jgi:predicted dehydrogenase|nr:oxidoreductase [Bacillota bacterium]HCF92545.1 oxidoreductase [Bacillota bacterium]